MTNKQCIEEQIFGERLLEFHPLDWNYERDLTTILEIWNLVETMRWLNHQYSLTRTIKWSSPGRLEIQDCQN